MFLFCDSRPPIWNSHIEVGIKSGVFRLKLGMGVEGSDNSHWNLRTEYFCNLFKKNPLIKEENRIRKKMCVCVVDFWRKIFC